MKPPGGSIKNPENRFNAHTSPGGPSKPLGGFWKFFINAKIDYFWSRRGTTITPHVTKTSSNKCTHKKSSPNLVILAKIWNCLSSPCSRSFQPLSPLQVLSKFLILSLLSPKRKLSTLLKPIPHLLSPFLSFFHLNLT